MLPSGIYDAESLWRQSKEAFWATRLQPDLIIEKATLVEGWGLPIRNGEVAIPEAQGFGWSREHIEHVRSETKNFTVPSHDTIVLPSAVLLSFPGAYTYGHWIIDISSRLAWAHKRLDFDELKFIVPFPFPIWAKQFLDAFNVKEDNIVEIGGGRTCEVERLLVPSFARCNDYLPEVPRIEAFMRLREVGRAKAVQSNSSLKLYVKHSPMTSIGHRQTLQNSHDIELLLDGYGFVTIIPAEMSREETMEAFSQASIIIGEDASSLHNCIYSKNCSIFVLSSPNRLNLLHFSIARLLDYNCVYLVGTSTSDGGFVCSVADLKKALDVAM